MTDTQKDELKKGLDWALFVSDDAMNDVLEIMVAKIEEAEKSVIKSFVDWATDHYWDSLEKDRDLIIKHIEDNFKSNLADK